MRVTDEFMRAVEDDGEWETRNVTDGQVAGRLRARELLRAIAESAHVCGDPGLQFDTTINDWHTCPETGRINASNPCCFTGETEVLTSEGRIRIDTLAGRDESRLPRAVTRYPLGRKLGQERIVKAWKAGETRSLVEVVTGKGLRLRCTPDHRFYLADGRTVPASDLEAGRRLCTIRPEEENQRAADEQNGTDTVRSVETIEVDPTPVYDLEVDSMHRFSVTTAGAVHGVIVSNSEYVFLDDSACNLASLNLMRFAAGGPPGTLDPGLFRAAVRTMITAQEIIVGNAGYPTGAIARNSHDYRPLGLGYANLGALLMARGLPYDSDTGRHTAAAVTALMTGEAYAQSARIARDCGGTFAGYARNEEAFLEVIRKHRRALGGIDGERAPAELRAAAEAAWDEALELGGRYGFRNAQATVLAPTGTTGLMMDCDTTGVEPDIALVKRKHLVGGGTLRIVNDTVPAALAALGYKGDGIARIAAHIDEHETIEGAPGLEEANLPVFDCALRPERGSRSIGPLGHLRMVAAVQPFLSGAVSKTINLPADATVDDIERAYREAWRLGCKAVSVYRNGSKRTQPLDAGRDAGGEGAAAGEGPVRRKLSDERRAITHKFDIAGHEGYITVGLFDDGRPGEIFLVMAKEGSTISGFADAFAQMVSYGLQYGVPLEVLVDKFSHVRFEPAGMTRHPEVRIAKSIVDYLFRWLAARFLSAEEQRAAGVNVPGAREAEAGQQLRLDPGAGPEDEGPHGARGSAAAPPPGLGYAIRNDDDAPPCAFCGAIMIRCGTCYQCANCGATSGCG